MTKFIFTHPVDHSKADFDGVNRNRYPQQYLTDILQERVPNNSIETMPAHELTTYMNSFLPQADIELEQHIQNTIAQKEASRDAEKNEKKTPRQEAIHELAEMHGVVRGSPNYNEANYIPSCLDFKAAAKEKFPENGAVLAAEYLDNLRYSKRKPKPIQPEPLHTYTPKITTDISGIVVPIGLQDYAVFNEVLSGLTGLLKEQFAQITAPFDQYKNPGPVFSSAVQGKFNAMRQYFFERFEIPVFESHIYVPGDRNLIEPVGFDMVWKEASSSSGREDFIKFAFDKWIDTYFPKK